ncbi:hypothetical protein CCP3SC15_1170018 [Gammaproteobacteria bacterium]
MDKAIPFPEDLSLDTALVCYVRYIDQSEPSPGLVDGIMSRIRSPHAGSVVTPMPALREFVRVAAVDSSLRAQLANAANHGDFVNTLVQAGATRGFRFPHAEVHQLLRYFEAANDGELDDEQLDAVAAATQGDMQWIWWLLKDKP